MKGKLAGPPAGPLHALAPTRAPVARFKAACCLQSHKAPPHAPSACSPLRLLVPAVAHFQARLPLHPSPPRLPVQFISQGFAAHSKRCTPPTPHLPVLLRPTSERTRHCTTLNHPPACPTGPEGPPAGSVRLAGARVDALHEARPQGGRPHAGRPAGDGAHAQLHRHDGALQGVENGTFQ